MFFLSFLPFLPYPRSDDDVRELGDEVVEVPDLLLQLSPGLQGVLPLVEVVHGGGRAAELAAAGRGRVLGKSDQMWYNMKKGGKPVHFDERRSSSIMSNFNVKNLKKTDGGKLVRFA